AARPATAPARSSHLRRGCDRGPAAGCGVTGGGPVVGAAAWWSGRAVLSACGAGEPPGAAAGPAPAGVGLGSVAGSERRSSVLSMLVLLLSQVSTRKGLAGDRSRAAAKPQGYRDRKMVLHPGYSNACTQPSNSLR